QQRRLDVDPWQVAEADGLASLELETEEILECAGQALAPGLWLYPGQIDVVDHDPARVGGVELGEQLDQRGLSRAVLADDRYHRTGRKEEVDVIERCRASARVAERQAFEVDPFGDASRSGLVGRPGRGRGVVLKPGEPPRPVHPDAAQEADLTD